MSSQNKATVRSNANAQSLLTGTEIIRRMFEHIDNRTTDVGDETWIEPVSNYLCQDRLDAELELIRRRFVVFCPSSALHKTGDFVARPSAGVPLIAVRSEDGSARVFRNACRHRGVQLADGQGCKRALVCPYHGWTYDLDGQLKNIPHGSGFPDVDLKANGLVAVASYEIGGLIYVNQSAAETDAVGPDLIPDLIPSDYELIESEDLEVEANWKLHLESSLEGYHIRSTHTRTFYPRQYDNLTVVEAFGENNRIAFPYQSIEKYRDRPEEDWSVNGVMTFVYHLFPNVVVSTFPDCIQLVILEPLGLGRTRQYSYLLGPASQAAIGAADPQRQAILRGQDFAKTGAVEDREMVVAAQQGLNSGANAHLTFGLFESAIGRLHAVLRDEIG